MNISDKQVMAIIKKYCGESITLETDLLKEGLLDSFALISILSELEELGVFIDPAEEGISSFSTPKKIISVVNKLMDYSSL